MMCYLVRHGKDDDTVRGGWSNAGLTEEGILQVRQLTETIKSGSGLYISRIFSSDLERAKQTAAILADALGCPLEYLPEFREVNNGDLAGMKNDLAKEFYPNLFWNTLEWEEQYPNGESPCEFYHRVCTGWENFRTRMTERDENVMLVTHSGVINVILHIIRGMEYSNRNKPFPIQSAEVIAVEL